MPRWVCPSEGREYKRPRENAYSKEFADSGEKSMADAVQRFLSREANPAETEPDDLVVEDVLRGLASLGMKVKDARAALDRTPKPWPTTLSGLLTKVLRSQQR